MRPAAALAAVLGIASAAPSAQAQDALNAPAAIFRGLDTITGRLSEFEIAAGETLEFGRLAIFLIQCRYLPDSPANNSFAFVRIWDSHSSDIVFDAWMIASAPALSAMDHPRYDVWLIRCSTEVDDSIEGRL